MKEKQRATSEDGYQSGPIVTSQRGPALDSAPSSSQSQSKALFGPCGIFFRPQVQYLEWPQGEEGDGLSTIWGAPVFLGHPWPRPAHDRRPLQGCTHTAHTATTRTGRSKVRDNPLLLKHCRVQVCNDGVTLCVCGVCVYRCVCVQLDIHAFVCFVFFSLCVDSEASKCKKN